MRLAIDIGNTSVSLGWFDGSRLARRERQPTRDFTAGFFRNLIHGSERSGLASVSSVTLATVVPAALEQLQLADLPGMTGMPGRRAPIIRTLSSGDTAFSFPIEASPRARIGIDRLVNAEAVWREHGEGPALILDCGTATTLSVLHPTRGFLGGAIAPGIELMRDSLAGGTAQLFEVPLEAPASAIGTHTQSALQSGIVFGYAALVDGLIDRVRAELETGRSQPLIENTHPLKTSSWPNVFYPLFATGGNARHLLGVSRHVREWDPDLTLRGIVSFA